MKAEINGQQIRIEHNGKDVITAGLRVLDKYFKGRESVEWDEFYEKLQDEFKTMVAEEVIKEMRK